MLADRVVVPYYGNAAIKPHIMSDIVKKIFLKAVLKSNCQLWEIF